MAALWAEKRAGMKAGYWVVCLAVYWAGQMAESSAERRADWKVEAWVGQMAGN